MRHSTIGVALVGTAALLLAACSSGGGGSSMTPPPPSNITPSANAGGNQTVTAGATVTLNGTASSDPDGSIASYAWTQTAGTPTVTLSSATASQPTFTAPSVTVATTLGFSLTVTDDRGATSAASSVSVAVNPLAPGIVTGHVTFVRIPFGSALSAGLDYANPVQRPARAVLVRALAAGTANVLASTTSDVNGDYSLSVGANSAINIQVVAQMLRSGALPNWNFTVADLDVSTVPDTYSDGQVVNANAATTHDVAIPSGFDSSGVATSTRASAPFAILDTLYQAVQLVLGAAPNTNFPALVVDWAPDNIPEDGTFFTSEAPQHIVLTADTTADTDEYDQHVIAHEFGHYIEHNFSRADNIGGAHGLGDKLDPRVAFGEGFGYAFGAMVLNDPVTRDSFVDETSPGVFVQRSSTFNVETNPVTSPPGGSSGNYGCWCSESSVWSILWDVFDPAPDTNDTLSLGFTPIWNVLVGEQKVTPAFTTIFSFVTALKAQNPGSAAAIDTLVSAQNINSAQINAFATNENHFPTNIPSIAALPIYSTATVGGPQLVLRTVNDAAGAAGTLGNKLGTHRFVRFTSTGGPVTITATSSNPNNHNVDFKVFRSTPFSFVNSALNPPAANETLTVNTAASDYLIDVYDCANGCDTTAGTSGDYDLTLSIN